MNYTIIDPVIIPVAGVDGKYWEIYTTFEPIPERTCRIEKQEFHRWDGCYWETELSCGHTMETDSRLEPGEYCRYCGAEVESWE